MQAVDTHPSKEVTAKKQGDEAVGRQTKTATALHWLLSATLTLSDYVHHQRRCCMIRILSDRSAK